MPAFKGTIKNPAKKKRPPRVTGRVSKMWSIPVAVIKRNGHRTVLINGVEKLKRNRANAAGKTVVSRQGRTIRVGGNGQSIVVERIRRSRTAPLGRRSIISERAIISMNEEIDARTRLAIRKIGKSTGF